MNWSVCTFGTQMGNFNIKRPPNIYTSNIYTPHQPSLLNKTFTQLTFPPSHMHSLRLLVITPLLSHIHEVLHKHTRIQKQRPKAAQQPTEIHSNILAVNRSRFAILTHTSLSTASRLVHHNTKHIRQIAKTRKQEEQ